VTVAEECVKVLSWLEKEFPCGRPVKLRWRANPTYYNREERKHKPLFGQTYRTPAGMTIILSKRMCRRRRDAVDTMIHEWGHCMLWGPATLEFNERHTERDHKGAFGMTYWEIYDRYFHEGGCEEARDAN
jgi:hypothetical protein